MRNRFLLITLGLLLLQFPGVAQDSPGRPGDTKPVLFRGRVSKRYLTTSIIGTPMWDTTGFRKGSVVYNGRLYRDVLVDIDAFAGEINVKPSEQFSPVTPDREQIPWFTKEDGRFVNLKYLGVPDAKDGFYQVLYDGKRALLKRVRKTKESGQGNHNNVMSIGYVDGRGVDDRIFDYYQIHCDYYILDESGLTRIRGSKALLKRYKDRRKELREASSPFTGDIYPDRLYVAQMKLAEGEETSVLEGLASCWHEAGKSELHPENPSVGARKPYGNAKDNLPEGYFDEDGTGREGYDSGEQSVQAQYQNKVYRIGDPVHSGRVSKATVSGYVRDAATGKALPDVTVWDENTKTYSRTDSRGRYSIRIPVGDNILNFNEFTKQDLHLKVEVFGSGGLDVSMSERVTRLNAAMISAESRLSHRTSRMGIEKISMKTINKIPSAFGEGDILRAVLTLPGVKTVGEASGGFNVRGGSSDQNLILFNEGTIFNPSHMFGILSAFNPDVVDGVDLYKCSIPAEYGGRISSVLDVRSKDGDQSKVKGSLGLGLLTSRFHIEGPLKKERTTFILGGRTTYSDWLLKRIPKSSEYSNGTAGFSDVNFGITHKVDSANTLQAYGYYSTDRFSYNRDTTFRYGSMNAALRWRHSGRSATSWAASIGFDRYSNQLEDFPDYYDAYRLDTEIDQAFARLRFQTKTAKHTLSYGAELLGIALQGGHIMPYSDSSKVIDRTLKTEYALLPSVYVGDLWQIDGKLSFDYGVRLSSFVSKAPSSFRVGPEFRLSGKYTFNPNFSLKAGINSQRQYLHLISNTTSISPMDTWKLCDDRIRPVDGWQAAAGAYWTVFDGKVDLSAEGYWKNMWNYLDYKSGATLVMNDNLADDLVRTWGKAYGIEFMARKTVGRLSGWVAYTYSRTFLKEMEDRGINTINGGDWYKAPYDRPHDVKLVGNFAFTARYSLSANLDYSTGRPVTVPVGFFYYGDGIRLAYSDRNGYRIPDYFRLDLAFNIDPGHYLKAITHASVTLGCYNVTGRKNTYSVYYTTNGGRNLKGYMVSVFATQIPYINLNILF